MTVETLGLAFPATPWPSGAKSCSPKKLGQLGGGPGQAERRPGVTTPKVNLLFSSLSRARATTRKKEYCCLIATQVGKTEQLWRKNDDSCWSNGCPTLSLLTSSSSLCLPHFVSSSLSQVPITRFCSPTSALTFPFLVPGFLNFSCSLTSRGRMTTLGANR